MQANAIVWSDYAAVLFDMDGVLTQTAKIHAKCWKRMFDAYLQARSETFREVFRPFDIDTDYVSYVDGMLRDDGVRRFLASRGITLPEGQPDAPADEASVWGLANRKNQHLESVLQEEGVDVYEGSVRFVRALRSKGIKTAVVSASRNCGVMLQAAGIADLFDVRVDGEVAARLKLAGKPAPDTFLAAARLLDVQPSKAVVVEDALAGVAAGRAGKFGLVIGVDRTGNRDGLLANGADVVVTDLDQLM